MARRPFVLGQEALQIGTLPNYQAQQMAPRPIVREPQPIRQETGAAAAGDAFDAGMTRPLGGGGIGEALARFGESYLRTRGAREDRDSDESDRINERMRENARREALASAVSAYDPSRPAQQQNDALIRALGGGAPEEAVRLMQTGIQSGLERDGARDQYAWQRQYDNENPPELTPFQQGQMDLGWYNARTSRTNAGRSAPRQYPQYAAQSAEFANRMVSADSTLRDLEADTDPMGVWAAMTGTGTEDQRRIRQAQREFVNAILRRESGATIQQQEFDSAAQQYFPQPGDPPAVIEQKREARARAIQGLINTSQGAYGEWYGEWDGGAPPPQPGQQGLTGAGTPVRQGPARVRTYNPQTGRLE